MKRRVWLRSRRRLSSTKSKKKFRRLPTAIKFPGRYGIYHVIIERVSDDVLTELNHGEPCAAYWDDSATDEYDGRIFVSKELEGDDLWWTLWHEHGHAWLDLWARDENASNEEEE